MIHQLNLFFKFRWAREQLKNGIYALVYYHYHWQVDIPFREYHQIIFINYLFLANGYQDNRADFNYNLSSLWKSNLGKDVNYHEDSLPLGTATFELCHP